MIEYALYKGDEFIMIGTRRQLAERLGVSEDSVQYYMTPTYKKRRKTDNCIVVFRLDDESN